MFQDVITEHRVRQNGYEYHISPFYTIIQGCQWLSPRIVSSIISANLVDPLNFYEDIMTRFLVSDRYSEKWSAIKRNAVTILTQMEDSDYQNQVIEMLNEKNINRRLPSSQVSKLNPVDHCKCEWWNIENVHGRKCQDGGMSVFGFKLQNKWEQCFNRDTSTLLEFRHPIMFPFSDRGLNVKLHILEIYFWSPITKSISNRADRPDAKGSMQLWDIMCCLTGINPHLRSMHQTRSITESMG